MTFIMITTNMLKLHDMTIEKSLNKLQILKNYIGTHIHKEKTIYESINSYIVECNDILNTTLITNTNLITNTTSILNTMLENTLGTNILPCQMYLRNPRNGSGGNHDINDLKKTAELIKSHNIKYYTHSALIINLARPVTKKDPNNEYWILNILKEDIKTTVNINGSGIVVHLGNEVGIGIDKALNKMEQSIKSMLPYVTENCPLLIETSAGEGTDLCPNIIDLSNFYNRFSKEEKKVLKICIDTCHVFAAGYMPLNFLMSWEINHPGSVKLVHFNDSKNPINSRVDRHSFYLLNEGYIGFEHMMLVAEYCMNNNIPMVTE